MRWTALSSLLVLVGGLSLAGSGRAGTFGPPEPVTIQGYGDHVMEPFISCDGSRLLFNNRNGSSDQTDLHWAERIGDTLFRYRGKLGGANSQALDGVPAMDCRHNLYFISTRSYDRNLSTIYQAVFETPHVRDVRPVPGMAAKERGIVRFDVEISPDGQSMYYSEGTYNFFGGPWSADIHFAERQGDRFVESPQSAKLLANVNTSALEYAAAVSHDGLELFFTRLTGTIFWPTLSIERSWRKSLDDPWSNSETISSISGFVEAPATTADGKRIYFHMKVDDRHRLYLVRRR